MMMRLGALVIFIMIHGSLWLYPQPQSAFEQLKSLVRQHDFIVPENINTYTPINEENCFKSTSFYEDYLKKYYPKAFVMTELFLAMKPHEVAQALDLIIDIFTNAPWFYFKDFSKGFKLVHYWEYVIDQLAIVNNFLKRARVDRKTQVIFLSERTSYPLSVPTDNLLLFLKKTYKAEMARFYALSFDYLIKLFNEGILLGEPVKATQYYYELSFVATKLRDTEFENEYRQAFQVCKELLDLLKQKCGATFFLDDNDDFYGNDYYAN